MGSLLRSASLSVLLVGLVVLPGCRVDGGITTTPFGLTYALVSVDGRSLPSVLRQTGVETVEVIRGQFELNAEGVAGRYLFSYELRTTAGGSVATETITDSGSSVLEGAQLTLTSDRDGSDRDVGITRDQTVSLIEEGVLFFFVG